LKSHFKEGEISKEYAQRKILVVEFNGTFMTKHSYFATCITIGDAIAWFTIEAYLFVLARRFINSLYETMIPAV
jgi:hypothetical protein